MCCQTAFKLCANLALTGIFKQDITGRQGYILKRGNSCIYLRMCCQTAFQLYANLALMGICKHDVITGKQGFNTQTWQ